MVPSTRALTKAAYQEKWFACSVDAFECTHADITPATSQATWLARHVLRSIVRITVNLLL